MFALTVVVAHMLGQSAPLANLDFARGDLRGWDGDGFYLTAGSALGPRGAFGVCSSDAGSPKRRGMIRYAFTVPDDAGLLRFHAFAAVKPGVDIDNRLDVVLAGADNRPLERKLKTSNGGWATAPRLLPRWQGKPREYCWDLTGQQGRTLQIVLLDRDERPGHYLYAAGFRLEAQERFEDREFVTFMTELQQKHHLTPLARYDSRRFTAISNAADSFTIQALRHCEIFHDQFLDHFRDKGFTVYPPKQRLTLAIFDGPQGFEAYMGHKMPSTIAGIYHTPTNRLVLYDLAENRAFVAGRERALQKSEKLRNFLDKARYVEAVERYAQDASKDANLSTTLHEAAHLISFNCGLLNRWADNPGWLVEGMACYCEATNNGDWVVLGAANDLRIRDLARARGNYVPLIDLIQDDAWRHDQRILTGYAQSWALFRMLMDEHPIQLKRYLQAVARSRSPEDRVRDFRAAFGDLPAVEWRFVIAMNELVKAHSVKRPR